MDIGNSSRNLSSGAHEEVVKELDLRAERDQREKKAKKDKRRKNSATATRWRRRRFPSRTARILKHPETLAHEHRSKKHAWMGLCQQVQMDRQR